MVSRELMQNWRAQLIQHAFEIFGVGHFTAIEVQRHFDYGRAPASP